MSQIADGAPAVSLWAITWAKSSHSNPHGNCVEVAELADGKVAVRNSRHPGCSALVCARAEVAAFVRAVKEDEFDAIAR
jgi:hypothetical protein